MGLSDSGILLSESDLNPMEFTFLLRPTFQTDRNDQYSTVNSEEDEEGDENDVVGREKDDSKSQNLEEDDNGFRTPTALDRRIPAVLRCPMAPRKPKSRPITKRKTIRRQKMLRDLSREIQSLFPAEFLAGLSGKIKTVRTV